MAVVELLKIALQSHFRVNLCGLLIHLTVEACAYREHQHYLVRIFNAYPAAHGLYLAVFCGSSQTGGKEYTVTAARTAVEEYHIMCTGAVVVVAVVPSADTAGKGNGSRLGSVYTHHKHLVGGRYEVFLCICHFVHGERSVCNGAADIETAGVFSCFSVCLKGYIQLAKGHIPPHIGSNALHFVQSRPLCLRCLSLSEKPAYFRKAFPCVGIYPVAETARPDRVLIEDDSFV